MGKKACMTGREAKLNFFETPCLSKYIILDLLIGEFLEIYHLVSCPKLAKIA